MFDDEDRSNSSGGGRRVDNLGPILLSPGGTFNMPADTGFNMGFSEPADKSSADDDVSQTNNSSANTESNPASDSNYQLIKRDLFGGAISMQIPGSFQDVSTMREVPDHQEVYVDRDSDMSLIVELLSYDEAVSNEQAAAHYYNDLAQCNEAGASSCIECSGIVTVEGFMPHLHKSSSSSRSRTQYAKCGVIGRQTVTKFRKRSNSAFDEVLVLLCVVRLADVETDLLISLNVPMKGSKQPLSACQTAPPRSQDPGSAWRGCTALLKPCMPGQSVVAAPTIAEMLHTMVLRGQNSVEKSDCLKARTSDLSEHRKNDFNLSPSLTNASCKIEATSSPEKSSPAGVSLENLTLDPGSGSGSGSGSEGRKRTWKLSSLEVMRAALQSIDIHNWSLFA